MRLILLEDHKEIYENEEISKIIMSIIPSPTPGKVRSVAESGYSGFKNRFYVAHDSGRVVGILGVSQIDHGVCRILHIGVAENLDMMSVGKEMINQFKDENGSVLEITAGSKHSQLSFYKSCGFKDDNRRPSSESEFDLDNYPLKLKVRKVRM